MPELVAIEREGLRILVDVEARERGLLVAFTDRAGGDSAPPYASLNLGASVGDAPDAVAANRARVARALGFDPEALVVGRQVHGADAREVAVGESGLVGEADCLWTAASGPVLGILTADCAPVLLEGEGRVAVVHAGWRGLVAGVVGRGVDVLAGARRAWVGPCIHSCCYEVGEKVIAAFHAAGLPVADPSHVDIRTAAVAALAAAGVADVAWSEVCTSCGDGYFSHRRDAPTGRQGGFIALLPT